MPRALRSRVILCDRLLSCLPLAPRCSAPSPSSRGLAVARLGQSRKPSLHSSLHHEVFSALHTRVPVALGLPSLLALQAPQHKPESTPRASARDGQQPVPPQVDSSFVLDGVSFLNLAALPPMHLLSTFALQALRFRQPSLWGAQDFLDGAEQAFRFLFGLLAHLDIEELEDLVEAPLNVRLVDDEARAAAAIEGWSAPPVLRSCRLLGLLGAGGIEAPDDEGGRRIVVTPVFYSVEDYSYDSGAIHMITLHRIQKWTFSRRIDGEHPWRLSDIGSPHWFWQRNGEQKI